MGHHERMWLSNYDADILFYHRYIDNTFCLFNTEADANLFYDYINSPHPNIKFTMFSLIIAPLLSLLGFFAKTVHGCFDQFLYLHVLFLQRGSHQNLVDRTFKINNTWSSFHKDVINLVQILKKSLFPSHLIENTIKKYVTKAVSSSKSFDPDLGKTMNTLHVLQNSLHCFFF